MNRAALLQWLLVAALLFAADARALTTTRAMTPQNQFFASGPQADLEIAIRADDVSAVTRSLAHGAAVNATGKFNVTPLMVAVDAQSPRAVAALLKAGALPNAKALDGNGPVSLAVKSCRAEPNGRDIMLAVFKGGGDPNTRQPDDDPVLMRFILDHDASGLALMKSLGANLNIRDRAGRPMVNNVAMSQDWDMAWALIELGAEVHGDDEKSTRELIKALNLKNPSPDSPLHAYKVKVWQFLRDKGLPVQSLKD